MDSDSTDPKAIRDSVSQGHVWDTLRLKGLGKDFPFPLELIAMILGFTPICDVVRYRQVSKAVCELIDNSPFLQYRIELLLGGMEDTGASPLSVHEKRKLLTEYLSRRTTLRPDVLVRNYIGLGSEKDWSVGGGLCHRLSTTWPSILKLPSYFRDPDSDGDLEGWVFKTIKDIELYLYEVDVPQDLILIAIDDEKGLHVKALSLSSEERHPASACDSFTIGMEALQRPGLDLRAKMNIVKDQLVVGLYWGDWNTWSIGAAMQDAKLLIIDWGTGEVIRTLLETTFHSYVLLDDDHLLLVFICPAANAPKISIINFRNPEHPKISFLFPEFLQERDAYHLDLSVGSTPPAIPNPPTFPPFKTTTTDKIITLSVFTDSSDRFLFVVPSWVLNLEVERVRREVDLSTQEEYVIPWDSWGPRGTAFFPTISRSFFGVEDAALSTSGTIHMTVEENSIILRDFNRYALRRDTTGPLEHTDTDTSEITSGRNEVDCELFKYPFSASLPWRKFKTELRLEQDLPVAFVHEAILIPHELEPTGDFMEIITF